jgi:hypothetical protein
MSGFAPIKLIVIDGRNNQKIPLFEHSVPFTFELNARQVMEQAFVLTQTTGKPDPLLFTVEYFGYSEFAQFPGYLGYEIVSIANLANSAQFFWDLKLDGVSVSSGADTTFPAPGATVTWEYTPVPTSPNTAVTPRTSAVLARSARRAGNG